METASEPVKEHWMGEAVFAALDVKIKDQRPYRVGWAVRRAGGTPPSDSSVATAAAKAAASEGGRPALPRPPDRAMTDRMVCRAASVPELELVVGVRARDSLGGPRVVTTGSARAGGAAWRRLERLGRQRRAATPGAARRAEACA